MELPFELSFGLISGQTYWWWCECVGRIYWQSSFGLVGEPDALVGRVERLFAA